MKIIIILAIVGIIAFIILRKFKTVKIGALVLIDGGVKTGKTTNGVYQSIKTYKFNHRMWRVRSFFCRLLSKPLPEEPHLYSNIPIAIKDGYYPVTTELLQRKARPTYKSVVYLSEASLVADNMLYKDEVANEQVMLFCKLFGHMTRGGTCVLDTQAIGDLAVAVRRCVTNTLYVHHLVKWIPFFIIAYVIEERYAEDGSAVQVYQDDMDTVMKKIIIPKTVWRRFDCYCYDNLTAKCPILDKCVHADRHDLQAYDVVSFRTYKELKK